MAGTVVAAFWERPVSEAAMWTPEERLLVGDFGSGQALTERPCKVVGEIRLPLPWPACLPRGGSPGSAAGRHPRACRSAPPCGRESMQACGVWLGSGRI